MKVLRQVYRMTISTASGISFFYLQIRKCCMIIIHSELTDLVFRYRYTLPLSPYYYMSKLSLDNNIRFCQVTDMIMTEEEMNVPRSELLFSLKFWFKWRKYEHDEQYRKVHRKLKVKRNGNCWSSTSSFKYYAFLRFFNFSPDHILNIPTHQIKN